MAQRSSKRDKVIEALLSCGTVRDAAKAAGVGERTIHRWLRDDTDFAEAYQRAKRQAFEVGIGRLVRLTDTAVAALEKILTDPNTTTTHRLAAIRIVLERATDAHVNDLEELAHRIEESLHRFENDSERRL